MAKIQGIFQFTGKLGTAVGFKGEDGKNYGRVLVDKIANPNTDAQVEVRNKMSLAGQLSALLEWPMIVGLKGGSKRKRRARLTALIIDKTNTSGAQAILAPADLVLSEGRLVELGINPRDITYENGTLAVEVPEATFTDEIPSVVITAVFSQNRTGDYIAVEQGVATKENRTVSFKRNANLANVYAIPVMRAEGATDIKYEKAVANIEATNSYAVTAQATTAGILNYGASQYVSSATQSNG